VRTLPAFDAVAVHAARLAGGVAAEDAWMARAAAGGRAEAHLWRSQRALVVPRSYGNLPRLSAAAAASAARGWPVEVRRSGGGLVPQGPGLLNVSLAWRTASATPRDTDAVYADLCDTIGATLASFGIAVATQEVEGSFCDGRFNLAAGGRKLVGTAQAWRRVEGQPVTLAHAVLLVDVDPERLTAVANAFESEAGGARRYRSEAITSIAREWSGVHGGVAPPADLEAQLIDALVVRFGARPR
jgi:lipoate-protein ligase A